MVHLVDIKLGDLTTSTNILVWRIDQELLKILSRGPLKYNCSDFILVIEGKLVKPPNYNHLQAYHSSYSVLACATDVDFAKFMIITDSFIFKDSYLFSNIWVHIISS